MSIFQSELKQQKLVSWVAKLATLVVSAPATISVAKRAYADVEGTAQVIVISACVVLVEFAFLWMWLKVESSKANANKDEQIQQGYVAGVWVMYGILLLAGFLHGEGMLTLLFRGSMGLLIFIATRDRLLLAKAKIEEQFANGVYQNKQLISKQRKANETVANKMIDKSKKLQLKLIDKDVENNLAKLAESSVLALVAKYELTLPKISSSKSVDGPLDTEFYTVRPIDDQYEITCSKCGTSSLWPSRVQAVRSGNAHSKAHKNGNGHHKAKLIVGS